MRPEQGSGQSVGANLDLDFRKFLLGPRWSPLPSGFAVMVEHLEVSLNSAQSLIIGYAERIIRKKGNFTLRKKQIKTKLSDRKSPATK